MNLQTIHERTANHPGYEDAVVPPTPKYTGMNPSKMLWKSKPLTNDEIVDLRLEHVGIVEFARAIEERHGIK